MGSGGGCHAHVYQFRELLERRKESVLAVYSARYWLHLHLHLLLIHLRMLVKWMLLLRLWLAKLRLLLVVYLHLHLRVGRLARSRHLCELALLVVHGLALSDNLLLLPLHLIVLTLLFELPLRDARRICELGALPRRDERCLEVERRRAPLVVGWFVAR